MIAAATVVPHPGGSERHVVVQPLDGPGPAAAPGRGRRLAPHLVVDEVALVVLDVAAAVERLAVERTEFRSRSAAVDPRAARGLDPGDQRLELRSLMVSRPRAGLDQPGADRGPAGDGAVVAAARVGGLFVGGNAGEAGGRLDVVS